MKYTILAVSAALCLGSASAATINAGNLIAGAGDTIVTDNAGAPIADVHSFLSIDSSLAGVSDAAGLQAIGGGLSLLAGTNAFPGTEGLFTNGYNGAGGTGQAIYLILSNSADLGSATLLGLINTGQTLDPDGASPDSNNYGLASGVGSAQVGSFRPDMVTADWSAVAGAPNTGPQFSLELIPEPSTSLLAGLAALGLLVRRKR